MNNLLGTFGAALLAAAVSVGPSLAQGTGSEGVFEIYNNTDNNVVVGFYTNGGDGWSTNWLSEEVQPGGTATAEFTGETGPCDQVFQVGWLGSDGSEVMDDPISIDICAASNVYLGDNEITYD